MRLYYVHDPMCSWCWAFTPALARLSTALPADIALHKLLGGLAADSDKPMPAPMREQIEQTWRHIQQSVPGTEFNFDFWRHCQPRRSTWPACRAVLIAREAGIEEQMNRAIQRAYYLQARNPSDSGELTRIAGSLGLDADTFAATLNSAAIRGQLEAEIRRSRDLGVRSYPSLVLDTGRERWPIAVDYNHAGPMLEAIASLVEMNFG